MSLSMYQDIGCLGGEFVVVGGNAAEVLEAEKGNFDEAAVAVEEAVVADGARAGAARDDGYRSRRTPRTASAS